MQCVNTSRLQLIPLTHAQLLLCSENRTALERELDLQPSNLQIDAAFRQEMNQAMHNCWLPNTYAYPDLYAWYTNWEIVLKCSRTAIGSIAFGGYPDDYGATSVGYVISKQEQGQRYATEALRGILQWGFAFSVLKQVNADTSANNVASQKVLHKVGFKQNSCEAGTLFYRLYKRDFNQLNNITTT